MDQLRHDNENRGIYVLRPPAVSTVEVLQSHDPSSDFDIFAKDRIREDLLAGFQELTFALTDGVSDLFYSPIRWETFKLLQHRNQVGLGRVGQDLLGVREQI